MSATPAELQRRIAAEFDKQGWEYDLAIGPELVVQAEATGPIDGDKLAAALPAEFFQKNRAKRQDVALAIHRAIGGLVVERDTAATTLVINDNRYQINMGPGARIGDSNINVGKGSQVNIDLGTPREDLLAGLEVLVRAGLAGDWNSEAAKDLATVIDKREDVDVEAIREATKEVVQAEMPKRERAKELLTKIAVGGLGGALATGISAGIGELLSQLPM